MLENFGISKPYCGCVTFAYTFSYQKKGSFQLVPETTFLKNA